MSERSGRVEDAGDRVEVVERPEVERFELLVGGRHGGWLEYHIHGRVFTATHTEVEPWLSGRGMGSLLVRDVLAGVRRRGFRLQPRCPFVRAYVERHPDEADVVGGSVHPDAGGQA